MKSLGDVVEDLRRSTVQVFCSGQAGVGSGIVWNQAGLLLTNAHVARTPSCIVELWDGRRLAAVRTKQDKQSDLAALQISSSNLQAIKVGDPANVKPGEMVVAVGSPLGFVGAVSTGVIHRSGARWIESSVRLAPGNSGGPLANAKGELIGINTMIASFGRGAQRALSIPSSEALRFLQAPLAIGLTVQPVRIPREGTPGFLILRTTPGLAADQASLMIADLIVGANGKRFQRIDGLDQAVQSSRGSLVLHFRRGGASNDGTVTLQLEEWKSVA